MQILKLVDEGIYNWDMSENVFSTIESYLFRRLITDKKTNVLNKMFAALARDISMEDEEHRLTEELVSKRSNQVFPRNSEFENRFQSIDIYNRRNNLVKLALMMFEMNRTKEPIHF